ncbi:MAG: hypothetical protein ABIE25_00395 [Thermoplasmatota archaeon]|nr:hypothetical protein [Candidatus Thermoplasmatota archaeon]
MAALVDVVGTCADNGLETGMSADAMIPSSSNPEELVSRNSESISRD